MNFIRGPMTPPPAARAPPLRGIREGEASVSYAAALRVAAAASTIPAHFSPIMMVGALVLPLVSVGMIEDYDMSRAKRAERVDAAAAAWILESALARLR